MALYHRFMELLDTTRQNLRITINRSRNLSFKKSGAEVNGRKRIGDLAIKSVNNLRIIRDGVALDIENQQNRSDSNNTQFIQLIDGEKTYISIGQSNPYTQEWITLTQHYASVQRTTEFVTVDTGFAVRQRTIGNQIDRDNPQILIVNQCEFIDFKTLITTISASREEWLDLAGLIQQKEDIRRAIRN